MKIRYFYRLYESGLEITFYIIHIKRPSNKKEEWL